MSTLEGHGITTYVHAARKVKTGHVPPFEFLGPSLTLLKVQYSDFDDFDYVFAMDRSNLSELQRLKKNKPDGKAKVMLFGEYSGTGKVETINDPYYDGEEGFEKPYEQATRFSKNFLKSTFPDVETEI